MCVSIPSYWRLFPSPLYGVGSVKCIAVIIAVTNPNENSPGDMVLYHNSLNVYRLDEAKDGCGIRSIIDANIGKINLFIATSLLYLLHVYWLWLFYIPKFVPLNLHLYQV